MNSAADDKTKPASDEPEISSDESVPIDGKDPVGEKMMDDLGKERGVKKSEADSEPMPKEFPVS